MVANLGSMSSRYCKGVSVQGRLVPGEGGSRRRSPVSWRRYYRLGQGGERERRDGKKREEKERRAGERREREKERGAGVVVQW